MPRPCLFRPGYVIVHAWLPQACGVQWLRPAVTAGP